jgi:hypothetical protein
MGGMTIGPAFGQQYENRDRAQQDRGRADDRYRNEHRNEPVRRPTYQRPDHYRYSQPVYAPRSAYYYQPDPRPVISIQSPGISLFFPLDIR